MRRTPLRIMGDLTMTALLLGVSQQPTRAQACYESIDPVELWFADDPDPWARMLYALDTLWSGTRAEKLTIANEYADYFDLLIFPRDDEAEPVVKSLRDFLVAESDEWVLDQLSSNLAELASDELTPYFLDALQSSSPNLRRRAAEHFGELADSEARTLLETAWKAESRPWVQLVLIDALETQGSVAHAVDCLELIRSEDRDLAQRAIETVGLRTPPGSLDVLIDAARDESYALRTEAVRTLARWSESQQALAVVLEASREPSLQSAAIDALGEFPSPNAGDRLVEILLGDGGDAERIAAITALGERNRPGVIAAYRSVLAEGRIAGDALDVAARRKLIELGLVSPSEGDQLVVFGRYSCGFGVAVEGELAVEPPSGRKSIRCETAPGIAGLRPRLPAGAPVTVFDHFETEGDEWLGVWAVSGQDHVECWIPASHVGKTAEGASTWPASPLRYEFDVCAGAFESDEADLLRDGGLLIIVELGEPMSIGSLTVDPADDEAVALLIDAMLEDDELERPIRSVVDLLLTDATVNPDMRRLILRAVYPDVEVDLQAEILALLERYGETAEGDGQDLENVVFAQPERAQSMSGQNP